MGPPHAAPNIPRVTWCAEVMTFRTVPDHEAVPTITAMDYGWESSDGQHIRFHQTSLERNTPNLPPTRMRSGWGRTGGPIVVTQVLWRKSFNHETFVDAGTLISTRQNSAGISARFGHISARSLKNEPFFCLKFLSCYRNRDASGISPSRFRRGEPRFR